MNRRDRAGNPGIRVIPAFVAQKDKKQHDIKAIEQSKALPGRAVRPPAPKRLDASYDGNVPR
jgi:hypothetical protein